MQGCGTIRQPGEAELAPRLRQPTQVTGDALTFKRHSPGLIGCRIVLQTSRPLDCQAGQQSVAHAGQWHGRRQALDKGLGVDLLAFFTLIDHAHQGCGLSFCYAVTVKSQRQLEPTRQTGENRTERHLHPVHRQPVGATRQVLGHFNHGHESRGAVVMPTMIMTTMTVTYMIMATMFVAIMTVLTVIMPRIFLLRVAVGLIVLVLVSVIMMVFVRVLMTLVLLMIVLMRIMMFMAVTMMTFLFMVFVLLRMIMMLVFVLMVPVLAMIVPMVMVMLGGRLPCLPGDQVHATLGATTRLVLDNFRVHGADIVDPGVQNSGVEILGGV